MAVFVVKPEREYEQLFGGQVVGRMRITRPLVSTVGDDETTLLFEKLILDQIKYIDGLEANRFSGNRPLNKGLENPALKRLVIDDLTMEGVLVIQKHEDGLYTLSVDNLLDYNYNNILVEEQECQEPDLDTSNVMPEKWSIARLLNLIIYGKLGKRPLKSSLNNSWNHGLV
jgi:hypothetical protein